MAISLSSLFEQKYSTRLTDCSSSQITVFANVYYYIYSKTEELKNNKPLHWIYQSYTNVGNARADLRDLGEYKCSVINLCVNEEEWAQFTNGGFEGFKRLEAVENYIASAGETGVVLVSTERKLTVIILHRSSMNVAFLANLSAAMPVYLTPWAYPEGLSVGREVIELASLISQRKWKDVYNLLCANYDAHISEELM
ncbi:MAG: hypothetical protein ACI4KR_00445, partial [Ruminiclostridium sp.]